MPKAGRELTQEIIDRHNEITALSKEAARKLYTSDGMRKADIESPEEENKDENKDEE